MVPTPPIVPFLRYQHRPALRLLLGCILGIVLYETGLLIWGSIVLWIIAVTAFILSKRIPTMELLMWLSIVGILFGWYSELWSRPVRNIPDGITLYDTNIKILYPISSSAESQIQYKAKVQLPNKEWLTIRIQSPESITDCFGSQGVATLDLSALSTIPSKGYRNYLKSEGFEALGNIQKLHHLTPLTHPPLSSRLQRFRYNLIQQFDTITGKHISWKARGLIYALSLGDRSMLSKELKEQFASSGVAHILAVSGYHLGVIYGLVSVIMGRLLWQYRFRRTKYLLILLFLILYTLLTGASTATVRALLMSAIALGAKFLDRPSDPIQLLSLVMVIFLCIHPFAYYNVGLLLSISAVWGIYSFMPLFQKLLAPSIKWLKWMANVISISLAAQIGVFPFLLLYFGTASLGFLWSNIPIVFISGILIPLSLISFIIALIFGDLPIVIQEVLYYLSMAMEKVAYFFTAENYGINLNTRFDLFAVVLYYAIAYSAYRLLYSYVYRKEESKYIHGEKENGAL